MTWCAHRGISKTLFVKYLHMIDETLSHKFHTYSILTRLIKVEWLKYKVLKVVNGTGLSHTI